MAEYYYGESKRKPKERSLLMKIIDSVILVASFVSFIAISLTLVTSYYNPSISWIFPVVGLVSPAIYLGTFLLMLYWVIRWRLLLVAILLLPLLVGIPDISHYGKIEISKHYGDIPRRGTVRIMSFNVRDFIGKDNKPDFESFATLLEEVRPDIICVQEYNPKRVEGKVFPKFMQNYNKLETKGMALFTRYKLLDTSEVIINENFDSGRAQWADMIISNDTIRLFNLHLHSTAITTNDDEYLSKMGFMGDAESEDKLRGIIARFRNTSVSRAAQADTVAGLIADSPHRIIVCGDFNDTPNSYTFRTLARGLNDTFQKAGSGYPYTYRGFMNLLRIDHILVDKSTEVLEYKTVDSLELSDHLPVITTIKL